MPKQSKKADEPLPKEHWKDEPDAHDYPAAGDCLSLISDGAGVSALVGALQGSSIVRRKAKDLLRAIRLPLLAVDNPHVQGDLGKVRKEEKLSPVLLVRGSIARDVALTVADGYHRTCASYHIDEDADIPAGWSSSPRGWRRWRRRRHDGERPPPAGEGRPRTRTAPNRIDGVAGRACPRC